MESANKQDICIDIQQAVKIIVRSMHNDAYRITKEKSGLLKVKRSLQRTSLTVTAATSNSHVTGLINGKYQSKCSLL